MSDMEHAIEQVARTLWDHDNSHMSRKWRDTAWDDMGGSEPSEERIAYWLRARALADAGLISPYPLVEEWATRFPNGHLRPGKDMPYDQWWKGDPPKGVNVRRYVSDWMPADPAEGDGSADQRPEKINKEKS